MSEQIDLEDRIDRMTEKELNPTLDDLEDWVRGENESEMIRRGDAADRISNLTVDGIIRGLVEDNLADEIGYAVAEHQAKREMEPQE